MTGATLGIGKTSAASRNRRHVRVGDLSLGEMAREAVEYLFALIVMLETNSIWMSIDGSFLSKVLKVALIGVVALYLLINNGTSERRTFHGIVLALIIAMAYWATYALLVRVNVNNFMYFVLDSFAVYAFVRMAKDKGRGTVVLMKYRNLVFAVAAVSLFFWVFGSQLDIIQPTGTVHSTWGASNTSTGWKSVNSYYGIYFEAQSLTGTMLGFTVDTARNTAIFTEAPMSSLHMCIALIIELFYCPQPSRARIVVLVAAVLSTLSTTGYCLMILALTAKYVFSKGSSEIATVLKAVVIPLLMIAAAIVLLTLFEDKMDTSSGEDRARDFAVGFQAWLNSPILGYGYGISTYYQGVHYGFSNSITPILGMGGLFLAIPYIACAFKWVTTCLKERDLQKFLLFACFLFLFTITIMSYKFLTIFLFFAYHFPREGSDMQQAGETNTAEGVVEAAAVQRTWAS